MCVCPIASSDLGSLGTRPRPPQPLQELPCCSLGPSYQSGLVGIVYSPHVQQEAGKLCRHTPMERQKEDTWPESQEGHEAVTMDHAGARAVGGATQCHNIT